jgi:hypothetical protein
MTPALFLVRSQLDDAAYCYCVRARNLSTDIRFGDTVTSADPHGISPQIDLIGVRWLMIGEEP